MTSSLQITIKGLSDVRTCQTLTFISLNINFCVIKLSLIVAGITWLPRKDIPVSHNFTRAKISGAAIHDDYGSLLGVQSVQHQRLYPITQAV